MRDTYYIIIFTMIQQISKPRFQDVFHTDIADQIAEYIDIETLQKLSFYFKDFQTRFYHLRTNYEEYLLRAIRHNQIDFVKYYLEQVKWLRNPPQEAIVLAIEYDNPNLVHLLLNYVWTNVYTDKEKWQIDWMYLFRKRVGPWMGEAYKIVVNWHISKIKSTILVDDVRFVSNTIEAENLVYCNPELLNFLAGVYANCNNWPELAVTLSILIKNGTSFLESWHVDCVDLEQIFAAHLSKELLKMLHIINNSFYIKSDHPQPAIKEFVDMFSNIVQTEMSDKTDKLQKIVEKSLSSDLYQILWTESLDVHLDALNTILIREKINISKLLNCCQVIREKWSCHKIQQRITFLIQHPNFDKNCIPELIDANARWLACRLHNIALVPRSSKRALQVPVTFKKDLLRKFKCRTIDPGTNPGVEKIMEIGRTIADPDILVVYKKSKQSYFDKNNNIEM